MCKKSICLTRFTAILLLTALSLFTVFGCENNSEDEGGNETDDGVFNPYPYEDLSIYMDLPDYKNITVEKHLVEKSVAAELSYFFNEHGLYINITDGKAEHFDLVNISYVGFIDGETFEGGTSMSTDLLLGSETYIEGFEDGIIGMNAGEAKNLSLKFPETNPWVNAAEDFAVGTVITGKVARMTDFGAFVELAPGVDALLHVSQISRAHVDKPSDVLSIGQEITAKIVDLNEAEKKISLSMKALEPEHTEASEAAPIEEEESAEE